MKKITLFLLKIITFCNISYSQDPAYLYFSKNRALFNPSLVGSQGAQSWQLRGKSQWYNDGNNGYKTASFIFEETMPCSIIDIGLKVNMNEEGAGLYRTVEAGFLSSVFVPFSTRQTDHNLRWGVDFSFGQNSIDFSRLVFSDQLDPKYGDIFETQFISPNDGRSARFFNPGFGISLRSIFNKNSQRPISTNFGGAWYRFWSLSGRDINQSASVLSLNSSNENRLSFFAEAEFIPYYYGRQYLTIKPTIVYQKQGVINYSEAGLRLGLNRSFGISSFYHTSFGDIPSNNWLTFGADWLYQYSSGKSAELFFNYATNIGGLKNFSGPQFEFGISFHFAKSSICNWMGLEDDVPYGNGYACPIMAITPGKRKMYENIWYKN